MGDRRKRALLALVLIAIATYAGLAVALDAYGRRTLPDERFDAIVIAGCRVDPDGSPSPALAGRVRLAVRLFREGRAPRLAFTGGVGTYGESEARVASDLATSLGVPREAQVLEDRSTTTEENARLLAALLPRDARVIVVTDAYHVFRAERVFGRYFARAIGAGSIAEAWPRSTGALREVLAVAAYGVRGRL